MTIPSRPSSTPVVSDLSESLDVRFIVAGRLSPTTVPLHRERAALAAALGRAKKERQVTDKGRLGDACRVDPMAENSVLAEQPDGLTAVARANADEAQVGVPGES
jgi:hypothetical protein